MDSVTTPAPAVDVDTAALEAYLARRIRHAVHSRSLARANEIAREAVAAFVKATEAAKRERQR